ncbi:hypothetical protein SAMN04489761_4263 [Tenacibaculum sp. MAR_2009_124]|uniref:hypothetical protein n=1 Tax=Tenacibaculum sp. MAR_2009_124 TaxID=1250059 RepID=UPI000895B823|nr:hypothetical protein [Tenacibaculum sp. MAR_2009_124]SED09715.1 hypothetical protein SAMN04489761_4263 [Tenacibaculum sp. MAR_2009_124]
MITKIEIDNKLIDRNEYEGDFDELILDNIDESDIENYAEFNLNMTSEDHFERDELTDYSDKDMIKELEESGYIVVYPESIVEEMRIKELLSNNL